jgi:hypothetical protein
MDGWIEGEPCGVENCDSTLWIEDRDGTQTCQNGHTRERFAAGAGSGDDIEEYHLLGATTRKKKEKREKKKSQGIFTIQFSRVQTDVL